jgi:uncharacterized protein YjbI with pentapeptide repeats
MAVFYKGFVFETGVSGPLTVEGCPVALRGRGLTRRSTAKPRSQASIEAFARRYIDESRRVQRRRVTGAYLDVLKKGPQAWNRLRREFPDLHPVLAHVDLRQCRRRLDGIDFSYTNLTQANLRGLFLRGASFHQAILAKANLSGARLQGANFCRTDLYETNFRNAKFKGANLQGVQFARTDLRGADLRGCNVYGLSAWDPLLDGARQDSLRITYKPGGRDANPDEVVSVDGLDLAAFIYMTLNNRNISRVFEAAARKWVLLLGRFTRSKGVLERLAHSLKARQYVPIIFDFPRPQDRDLIETVLLLAGMSAFVIADISDPRSAPLELQAIAPNYSVPIVPIMRSNARAFGMFPGLRKFEWVLPIVPYRNIDHLLGRLTRCVIEPALAEAKRLNRWRAAEPRRGGRRRARGAS